MAREIDGAVERLADRFWEGVLELEPLLGTFVGDERYDDRLPDPSEEGLARKESFYRGVAGEAEALARNGLDLESRLILDIIAFAARRELDNLRLRMDRFQAVTHLFGPGYLTAALGSVQRADTPERLDRYVARLSALPRYLEEVSGVALEAAEAGQVAPALVVDRSRAQVERLLALDPADSPAMKPVAGGPEEARGRVASVLREEVWPAYARYLEALRAYRPSARDSVGLSALPGGEEMYATQVWAFTTLPLAPGDIHRTGTEQLERIQEERAAIARRLGFATAEEALAAHDRAGRNRARTRDEMLELVRGQVERSWEAAPGFFGRLPRANCEVRPVDEFQEDDMPGAYYTPPTEDGSRPGTYFVNTGHLEARPLHQCASTTFHEANPGHHFQLSLEMEFTERHPVRRFAGFLVGDAFVEGWGLYSERLADEMGLYRDEYERLGMLEAQGLRAGRLVVDTGIHALGWDRERAVRTMEETGASRVDAEIEVDRYIATPGQALAYMTGKLEIDRWRAEAARREGASFSLRDFHDRVLALGSLPLPTLARELTGSGEGRGRAGG